MIKKKKSVFVTTASVIPDIVSLCDGTLIQSFIFLLDVAFNKVSSNGVDAI